MVGRPHRDQVRKWAIWRAFGNLIDCCYADAKRSGDEVGKFLGGWSPDRQRQAVRNPTGPIAGLRS
jgi:hypothetical protein